MKILIAPDSFKGSLSAMEAARAMKKGFGEVFPQAEFRLAPIADGGEGTVEALTAATGGRINEEIVSDPLGRPVQAHWGLLGGGEAVVEMAAASGLPLLTENERDPRLTSSRGTGQLVAAALNRLHFGPDVGRRPRLIIGLGGSATNDGGAGCLEALGLRFLDDQGRELSPGGAALAGLAAIDTSGLNPLLNKTDILVACDVDNPLCGPRGASAVFGPQKGATPEMVRELDAALEQFARVASAASGRESDREPGAGAAGGLGAGLLFFTGARLRPGIDIVLEAIGLEAQCAWADLVLTGEGRTDFQTAFGKAPVGVAHIAKKIGRPVICLSGALGEGAEDILDHGVDALSGAVASVMTLDDCLSQADHLLTRAAARAARLLLLGRGLSD